MRIKKSNIKNGKITRTIPFTSVKYLSVDIETREVTEKIADLAMEYDKTEAETALREMGENVAAVLEVVTYDVKVEMDYLTFIRYGNTYA